MRKRADQRLECARGVGGAANLLHALVVQDRGADDEDEPTDQVGDDHPERVVDAHAAGDAPARPSPAPLDLLDLFYLLGRLPEEQVWGDRRAEDRGEQEDETGVEADVRHHCRREHRAPLHLRDERHHRVGEEAQRQPFQNRRVARIPDEDLERKHAHRKRGRGHRLRHRHEQPERGGHRRDVGGHVDGVRDGEQEGDCDHDLRAVALADDRRNAFAGDQADPRTGLLDGDHERQRERRHPQQAVPVLGA